MEYIEWFGTAMSVIVAISLTQKNIKKLRIINLIGAFGFSMYGGLIGAWPVLGLNAFICLINLYYLIQMKRQKDHFDVMLVDPSKDPYTDIFLNFHKKDIERFLPDFTNDKTTGAKACFILREAMPAALIIFKIKDKDSVEILLDYAVPSFRDFSNASYFFDIAVKKMNFEKYQYFECSARTEPQIQYLKKMGFELKETVGDILFFRKNIFH